VAVAANLGGCADNAAGAAPKIKIC